MVYKEQYLGANTIFTPICKIILVAADCGTLPNITNGAVELSGGTTFPSVAVYSCDGGYELQGDPVRMCNESGVWNGREPTCIPIGSEPTSTGNKL